MTEPHILVAHDGPVACVTLNRPERRNALTGPMLDGLRGALLDLDAREDVRAILLRGAGGTFCAGADLKERQADPPPAWIATFPESWAALHDTLFDLLTPTVCALEGGAVGGGAALALACDVIVGGRSSRMHAPEVRLGVGAASAVVLWAAWRHDAAFATRLVVASEPIDAETLAALGVLYALVDDAEVPVAAAEAAARLALNAPRAAAAAKRILRAARPRPDFRTR